MAHRNVARPRVSPSPEMKRLLLGLVVAVLVLDATVIGVYFLFHIQTRAVNVQESFVAVWVVLTLIVVSTMLKKIRKARRRG